MECKTSNENLQSIIPKNFYPYCECREEKVLAEKTNFSESLRRAKLKQPLVPNHWSLDSVHTRPRFKASNEMNAAPSFLICEPSACLNNNQHREVALNASSVGVTGLDLVDGLQRKRATQGDQQDPSDREIPRNSVTSVLRNIDLLEHMITSHDDTNTIDEEPDDDYYENHKVWPVKPRKC